MLDGIHLTLMVGPGVATPVPPSVLDALTSVEVHAASGDTASGFSLTFALSVRSPLHTLFLLAGTNPIPIVRVILVVSVGATSTVLIDGVVTEQHVAPGTEPGRSTLTVTGKDLTAVMDRIDLPGIPYPATPPEARVALILAKYVVLGVLPKIVPSVLLDVPIPTHFIPVQYGSDLAYVRHLAHSVGYVFYLEPGSSPGTSFAYWGPQLKIGTPQPALSINFDAHTNVESLSFTFDAESNGLPTVYLYDENVRIPVPVPLPDLTPLSPPLGLLPPIPLGLREVPDTAKYHPAQALMIGMAQAAAWAKAVRGEGSLDVLRYGHILRARQLVGVRGAGPAFDGLHYVESVTHRIQRGSYKQSFTLVRNGLLSTVPAVAP